MIRARIVAEGKVQSVGYRDEVEDIAIDLGVKGFVRNMVEKDRVEIVCEADEKDKTNRRVQNIQSNKGR